MSPSSTARQRKAIRKVAICAAAVVVAILPTACGSAYAADSDREETVEVGGASASESLEEEDAEQGGDAADQEGETADDEAAAGEEAADGQAAEGDAAAGDEAAAEENADVQAAPPIQGDGGAALAASPNAGDRADARAGESDVRRGRVAGRERFGRFGGFRGGDGSRPPAGQQPNNGLDVLGRDCSESNLEPHDGFEEGPRCVSTAFGEVGEAANNPTLLITESPDAVAVNQDFSISVSTRNLVRDRFLGAAAGGYYLESSFLDGQGIQRGHFHTACRMLDSTNEAPNPEPAPEFFLATQDGGGGAGADTVQIDVTGMPEAGTAQCSVWAGDGSHRTPMMQRANQTPAFDSVRITVQ